MSQRGITWGLVVLMLVAAGLGLFSYLVFSRQHPPGISSSSFNRGKFGTHAFYRLLEERLGQVGRLGTSVFAWPGRATVIAVRPVTVLEGGPDYPISSLADAALVDWLERGNVLISFGLIWELEGALDLETADSQAAAAAEPVVKVGRPLQVSQLRLSSLAEEGKEGEPLLRVKMPELPPLDGLRINYAIVPDRLAVENQSGRPEVGLMRGFLALAGIPQPPLMEVIEVGEGRVVLVNLSQPVMNRWLGLGDNAAFALGVVELFRLRDAPLYFYELPHGNRSGGPSLVWLFFTTPGGLTLLGLTLAVFLILAPQIVPLRQSQGVSLTRRTSSLRENLHRMANFYQRIGAHDLGVEGLLAGARLYLGRLLGLARPLSQAEFERLARRLIEPRRYPLEHQALTHALRAMERGNYDHFGRGRRLSHLAHSLALLIALVGEGARGPGDQAGSRGR